MPKSFIDDNKLIREVCKKRMIYDSQPHDKAAVIQAWRKLSLAVGFSVSACKKRWNFLMNTYHKKHTLVVFAADKKMRKSRDSEASRWEHYKTLMFLEPFLDFSTKEFETVEDDDHEKFQNWGEFSAEIMSKSMIEPHITIKEEDPLGDDRILAESRRRKCTMIRPKLELSGSSHEEDNAFDDYRPSKSALKKKIIKNKELKFKCGKPKFSWQGHFKASFSDVNKKLVSLLLHKEEANEGFLLSMLAALKKLSPENKLIAKHKMRKVVEEIWEEEDEIEGINGI